LPARPLLRAAVLAAPRPLVAAQALRGRGSGPGPRRPLEDAGGAADRSLGALGPPAAGLVGLRLVRRRAGGSRRGRRRARVAHGRRAGVRPGAAAPAGESLNEARVRIELPGTRPGTILS